MNPSAGKASVTDRLEEDTRKEEKKASAAHGRSLAGFPGSQPTHATTGAPTSVTHIPTPLPTVSPTLPTHAPTVYRVEYNPYHYSTLINVNSGEAELKDLIFSETWLPEAYGKPSLGVGARLLRAQALEQLVVVALRVAHEQHEAHRVAAAL